MVAKQKITNGKERISGGYRIECALSQFIVCLRGMR